VILRQVGDDQLLGLTETYILLLDTYCTYGQDYPELAALYMPMELMLSDLRCHPWEQNELRRRR